LKQISTNGSGWDGTYNGQMLFSSDYWFTVTYQIGAVEKTFKAHFTLKR
jgi:gliding motility-associated-like protein